MSSTTPTLEQLRAQAAEFEQQMQQQQQQEDEASRQTVLLLDGQTAQHGGLSSRHRSRNVVI